MALELPNSLGPWQPKVTRIKEMWLQPCSTDVFLWVAGYMAASPVIAFSILSPDCLDYTADRFRGGARKRRKGRVSIGPPTKPVRPWDIGTGNGLFHIKDAAQRVGLFMLLIDATLDWVIHGTSFAYQFNGCRDPNQGFANLSMTNDVPLLLPATESLIYSWKVDEKHIFGAGGVGIATPKGHGAGVGFSLTQHLGEWLPLPDCSFYCRVIDLVTMRRVTGDLHLQDNDDGTRSVTWFSSTTGDPSETHHYAVYCVKTFGVMYVSGNFTCSGINLEGVAKSACGNTISGGF